MVYREKLMTEDGVALLFYRIELPEAMSEAEGALAERITAPVAAYLEGALTEALRSEYLASEHPRRRFLFRRAEYRGGRAYKSSYQRSFCVRAERHYNP